ncbi:hypothetical protein HU200_041010 [Digitaria exilis]|uniref:RNase H type-1 domain-containing protein n=1 Tax=Digitaria exilis TaxID=1010633 RepID=A0A835BJA4_9POAL|nr:hypothetical protein HU200_041010 [Digitaria exilis]
MILRGHGGDVITVEAKWYSLLPDALTSEALAARDGLLLAVAHGCSSRVFLNFQCVFVSREANQAAHCCAKKSSQSCPVRSWSYYTPSWLMGLVAKDCIPALNE